MTRLKWDENGTRYYRTGVDMVTLYVQKADGTGYENGVAWDGVSSIEESPSGAESTAIYADNIKYLDLTSKEDFGMSITAYDCPPEFDACDGCATVNGIRLSQQKRQRFGLVFRSNIGNDTVGNDFGYEYHICYNLKAGVSSKSHNTINDSPEAQELSWEITSTDQAVTGYKPTAKLTIRSTDLTAAKLTLLENTLFGSADSEPTLPSPDELIALLAGDDEGGDDTPTPEPEPTPTYTYTEVDKTQEGYAEMNPRSEGWYEESSEQAGTYIETQDTTVDAEKTYYTRTADTTGEG